MARTAKGTIVERKSKRHGRTYAARFQTNGTRFFVTLGHSAEGMTRASAEQELQNILADVRRGIWMPPEPEPVPAADADPTFWEFASEWFEAKRGNWSDNTVKDYRWQLDHLLRFFHAHRLSDITVAEVDRFSQTKLREAELGPESINKTADAARADPRARGRVRDHRPQPGEGRQAKAEGGAVRARLPRQRRAHRWRCLTPPAN